MTHKFHKKILLLSKTDSVIRGKSWLEMGVKVADVLQMHKIKLQPSFLSFLFGVAT
jgi:hypothetical protein